MQELDLLSIFFSTFLMFILTMSNIESFKSQIQRDYRITIFIIGLLSALIIIFIKSQEKSFTFLNALPFIICPIIICMIFLIIIGIYQNKTIAPLDIKYNMDYIAMQISKLNNLDELPNLIELNAKMHYQLEELKNALKDNKSQIDSIKENNITLFNNLSQSICDCINRIHSLLAESALKQVEMLNIVNKNLNSISNYHGDIKLVISKEIQKLSSNFSQDVINSIDNLLKAWKNSVEEHFSANFKEFNKGIRNMLLWQQQHKGILLDSNDILQKSSQSFDKIQISLDSILSRDENMLSLYNRVCKIMQDYSSLNTELNERLNSIRKLGISAGESLESMNLFFNKLNSYLTVTNENMINNTKKTINEVLLSSVSNFKKANMKIVNDLNDRDKKILEQIKIHTKNIENINALMLSNNKTIIDSYNDMLETIKDVIQSAKNNISDISRHSIKMLEDASDKVFKDLINKYLDSLEKLNIATFESSKEARSIVLEDIKKVNTELKEYLKANASLADITSTQMLSVLNQVQKYVVDISDMSKDININTKNTLKELGESLDNISDGFRGDYDWFLRRIREIIGSRIK